jgi:hypothetical protein
MHMQMSLMIVTAMMAKWKQMKMLLGNKMDADEGTANNDGKDMDADAGVPKDSGGNDGETEMETEMDGDMEIPGLMN